MSDKTVIDGILSKIQDCLFALMDEGISVYVCPIWTNGYKGVWITIENADIIKGNIHSIQEGEYESGHCLSTN